MGELGDAMRATVVERFYGDEPPEGVRLLYDPDAAFAKALVYEHWHFLQGFPRWCGHVIAGTPHLDVITYEVDNLHEELVHDAAVDGGHYDIIRDAAKEMGWTEADLDAGEPGPKMAKAIADWYDIARTRPWVETMAAVHGTEMFADQRLKQVPGFRMPNLVSDRSFLEKEGYGPKTRRWLSTTAADTEHSGLAVDLVETYAEEASTPEAVLRTFRRSMDDMALYFEAMVERRAAILDAGGP